MAILTMPIDRVASVRRTLQTATALARSPFTGRAQSQFWGGEWWVYEVEMGLSTRFDGRALSAFFTALGGARNTFLFADPTARYAGNLIAPGAPVVAGAGQPVGAQVVITTGWVPGIAIEAGTMFSLGSGAETRLYMTTAAVIADGSGLAALPITPGLRASPPAGAAIEYERPQAHLRLTSPVPSQMAPADKYRFSFTAEEAL